MCVVIVGCIDENQSHLGLGLIDCGASLESSLLIQLIENLTDFLLSLLKVIYHIIR